METAEVKEGRTRSAGTGGGMGYTNAPSCSDLMIRVLSHGIWKTQPYTDQKSHKSPSGAFLLLEKGGVAETQAEGRGGRGRERRLATKNDETGSAGRPPG